MEILRASLTLKDSSASWSHKLQSLKQNLSIFSFFFSSLALSSSSSPSSFPPPPEWECVWDDPWRCWQNSDGQASTNIFYVAQMSWCNIGRFVDFHCSNYEHGTELKKPSCWIIFWRVAGQKTVLKRWFSSSVVSSVILGAASQSSPSNPKCSTLRHKPNEHQWIYRKNATNQLKTAQLGSKVKYNGKCYNPQKPRK